jgi:hypothetical protein
MMTKTSVALAEGLDEGSPCTRASSGRTGEPNPHTEVCGCCFLGQDNERGPMFGCRNTFGGRSEGDVT